MRRRRRRRRRRRARLRRAGARVVVVVGEGGVHRLHRHQRRRRRRRGCRRPGTGRCSGPRRAVHGAPPAPHAAQARPPAPARRLPSSSASFTCTMCHGYSISLPSSISHVLKSQASSVPLSERRQTSAAPGRTRSPGHQHAVEPRLPLLRSGLGVEAGVAHRHRAGRCGRLHRRRGSGGPTAARPAAVDRRAAGELGSEAAGTLRAGRLFLGVEPAGAPRPPAFFGNGRLARRRKRPSIMQINNRHYPVHARNAQRARFCPPSPPPPPPPPSTCAVMASMDSNWRSHRG